MNDYDYDLTRREMIDRGYRPVSRQAGFTKDELDAFLNGKTIYPGRPFPPLVFGFDLVTARKIPPWCHRESLDAVRSDDGQGNATILYRVPINPPKSVRDFHAAQAKKASESPLYPSADETSPEAQRGAA